MILVIDHIIIISKYNPLSGSSYIKLCKELDHPRKKLINIQNIDDIDDNEFFKWCLFRFLNPADYRAAVITKDFARKINSKDIKFPVKIRDIIKYISTGISILGCENKEKISNLCIKKML